MHPAPTFKVEAETWDKFAYRLNETTGHIESTVIGTFTQLPLKLAWAMTVHKSQGSEYANVMLVVPPKGGKRLLTKELIYTAITRAKSLAVLCSAKDVLKFAIGRRIVRESGVLRF